MPKSTGSSKECVQSVNGWILDLYPKENTMVIWIKTEKGNTIRLLDRWQYSIYVSGNHSDLIDLAKQIATDGVALEEKYARPEDSDKSTVLKIPVSNSKEAQGLAEKILVYGGYKRFRLYNVDVKPSQMYLYEKDIFPFAFAHATQRPNGLEWRLLDSQEEVEYRTPPLKELTLEVKAASERIPKFNDAIREINIRFGSESIRIDSGDELDKLVTLVKSIQQLDPDILYTSNGDEFLFPYLARRAVENEFSERLVIGRERSPLRVSNEKGASYVSYDRVHYRPLPTRLLGRIHIDMENSMLYCDCGLQGLIEVARICRIPVQRVSNTTIGTSMTSAQLYHAVRNDILIPWVKADPEDLKTARELLIADRGGFYREPKVGIHDRVGELDFTSLYPMLMLKKNLSAETVRCKCCPDSTERVPELDYNICEKRKGIVPKSIELLLRKRTKYKELERRESDPSLRSLYEKRRAALKWILVCSFGYLGFKNARFGKIDAHIATCAFARQTLLKATRLAEERGFELVHGIVDSLWLKKKGVTESDFIELVDEIYRETELPISFQGVYRWIVFLPSETRRTLPVLTRYYGVFMDGRIKARGIATRRHDTPEVVRKCIEEMLTILAKGEDSSIFYNRVPESMNVLKKYVQALKSRRIELDDLVIEKHLSREIYEYRHEVLQAIAAKQLVREKVEVRAGQSISFIIINSENRFSKNRVLAAELVDERTPYDVDRYLELLFSSAATILAPFGYTVSYLKRVTNLL